MTLQAYEQNLQCDNIPTNQIMNGNLKGTRLYSVLYTSGKTAL